MRTKRPTEQGTSDSTAPAGANELRPDDGEGKGRNADSVRRAIMSAGEAVIVEKGFARVTVDDVVKRANLTPNVFQEHFSSMGALLRALSERFVEQMMTVTTQSTQSGIWKGVAGRDVIEVAARMIIDVIVERQGLVRALLSRGATDPALARDLRRIGGYMTQRIVAALAECTNVPIRSTRSVAFALLIAASMAHQHVLVGDGWAGVSFSKEQLTEEVVRAITAYLGLEPTIAIRGDQDGPPTEEIAAITTAEIEMLRDS